MSGAEESRQRGGAELPGQQGAAAEGPGRQGGPAPAGLPPDRGTYLNDDVPGLPLTTLLFTCAVHQEDQVVAYYDPEEPPRCSHGDLMARKAR
ncbi:hypothetical protein [Kitasatospora griseola]|uniref:hypothetical protein n=1 Tax=Kitasatospora griseola TaxID=2064 RepID=UPI00364AD599